MQEFKNKKEVFQFLVKNIDNVIEQTNKSINDAQEEANSHVGAMESRYDTFKEEAQYLADSQRVRLKGLESEKSDLMRVINNNRIFTEGHQKVVLGSFVTLEEDSGNTSSYIISPACAGVKVKLFNEEATILTPKAPLGKMVMGKESGDEVDFTLRGKTTNFCITTIK